MKVKVIIMKKKENDSLENSYNDKNKSLIIFNI